MRDPYTIQGVFLNSATLGSLGTRSERSSVASEAFCKAEMLQPQPVGQTLGRLRKCAELLARTLGWVGGGLDSGLYHWGQIDS